MGRATHPLGLRAQVRVGQVGPHLRWSFQPWSPRPENPSLRYCHGKGMGQNRRQSQTNVLCYRAPGTAIQPKTPVALATRVGGTEPIDEDSLAPAIRASRHSRHPCSSKHGSSSHCWCTPSSCSSIWSLPNSFVEILFSSCLAFGSGYMTGPLRASRFAHRMPQRTSRSGFSIAALGSPARRTSLTP